MTVSMLPQAFTYCQKLFSIQAAPPSTCVQCLWKSHGNHGKSTQTATSAAALVN